MDAFFIFQSTNKQTHLLIHILLLLPLLFVAVVLPVLRSEVKALPNLLSPSNTEGGEGERVISTRTGKVEVSNLLNNFHPLPYR